MDLQEYIISKTELQAVILSLEIRRDNIIKRKNPKNVEIVDDLTKLVEMLKRVLGVHVLQDKEIGELKKANRDLRLEREQFAKKVDDLENKVSNLLKEVERHGL